MNVELQKKLILTVSRSTIGSNMTFLVSANITLDELMTQLIQAVEVFQQQVDSEIVEEASSLIYFNSFILVKYFHLF